MRRKLFCGTASGDGAERQNSQSGFSSKNVRISSNNTTKISLQDNDGFVDSWAFTGKGSFFGLKMRITTDLNRKLLAVKFSSGNVDDREIFLKLNKDLLGLFIADAGYISEKLSKEFYIEHKRILIAKPRKNMKKIMTKFQEFLYGARMLIELNFRNLKMFYGLATSLPRSVGGYLANYIYSLLAYQIA